MLGSTTLLPFDLRLEAEDADDTRAVVVDGEDVCRPENLTLPALLLATVDSAKVTFGEDAVFRVVVFAVECLWSRPFPLSATNVALAPELLPPLLPLELLLFPVECLLAGFL